MNDLLIESLLHLLASIILGGIILKAGSAILKVMIALIWTAILVTPVFSLNPELYLLTLLLIALCLIFYLFNDNSKKKHDYLWFKQSLLFFLYAAISTYMAFMILTAEKELLHKPDSGFFILLMLLFVLLIKNTIQKNRAGNGD